MKNLNKKLLLAGVAIMTAFAGVACGKAAEVNEPSETGNVVTTQEITDTEETEITPGEAESTPAPDCEKVSIGLEDGVYLADFDTDSTMFRVNETLDGKGILTVKDGEATIHIVLGSKNIVNLFLGTVADLDESKLIEPSVEEIIYPDGLAENVHAFDVQVPYLDKEFDLALIGKKGVWYDHKVSVSNPEPYEAKADKDPSLEGETAEANHSESVFVTLTGGSGKATIDSPAKIEKNDAGQYVVTIVWSSPHYDYMIVDGEKIFPVNTEGNSTFEITIGSVPCVMDVIADTVAMSTPHEVEYTLGFSYEEQ